MHDHDNAPDTASYHAVQFYGSEASLFATVGGFLSEAIVAGDPAIVIATNTHRSGILTELKRRLIDVDRARRNGDLLVLDAHDLLEMFLLGGMPNAALFEEHVGSLIEQTLAGRGGTVVRAYGEMVDVLWKDGRVDAALALELLWNKLATKYGFALLCGYSMGHFYKRAEQMQAIAAHHDRVIPAEHKVLPFAPARPRSA